MELSVIPTRVCTHCTLVPNAYMLSKRQCVLAANSGTFCNLQHMHIYIVTYSICTYMPFVLAACAVLHRVYSLHFQCSTVHLSACTYRTHSREWTCSIDYTEVHRRMPRGDGRRIKPVNRPAVFRVSEERTAQLRAEAAARDAAHPRFVAIPLSWYPIRRRNARI